MLDPPWDTDPDVVVVMTPRGAKFSVRETPDHNFKFGCLQVEGAPALGLQVIEPQLATYTENNLAFRQIKGRMAQPAHIGKLSALPQKFLSTSDFCPLAFLANEMYHPYLNIKAAIVGITTKEDN
jgi:hypothetical protein